MKTALFDTPLRSLKDDYLYMPRGIRSCVSVGIEIGSMPFNLHWPVQAGLYSSPYERR